MSFEIWLTFVLTASLILVIPGPSTIYVVGQSLSHGKKACIPLSIGVILGDGVCLTISLLGLSTLLTIFSAAFIIVKYLGAIYLIYLGIKMLMANTKFNTQIKTTFYNSKVLFREAFLVNVLNPKGIIFYSAFLPQFVNPEVSMGAQFTILGFTFLCLALINVLFYSLLSSKTSKFFNSIRFIKAFNLTGGLSLICAGVYSATIEKK